MPDKKPTTFDELEEALAADFAENATREELETELARMGIDAAAIASRARSIAEERGLAAGATPSTESWQERARERLTAARDKVRTTAKEYAAMTRDQLLARLDEIRNHPGLTQPVTAAFRKRGPQEASDDELRAILADIESLISIVTDQQDE